MRLAILLLLAATPVVAASWTGYLVDSKCYAAEERNVNPGDTDPHGDSDMDEEIRYCVAKVKTKDFGVVPEDWNGLKFDAAGNAKAAGIVAKIGKKPFLRVSVEGELNGGTIKVESITVQQKDVTPGRRPTISSSPRIVRE